MALKKNIINFYRFHMSQIYIDLVDLIIERFNQRHPQIHVKSHIFSDWREYINQLLNDFDKSSGPDIFQIAGGVDLRGLVFKGKIQDITPHINGPEKWVKFYPHILKQFSVEDKVYAAPLEQGWIFFWYNKDIFKKLDLAPPKKFNELLDICKVLSSNNIIPFSLGMAEPWTAAFYYIYLSGRIGGYKLFEDCAYRKSEYSFLDKSFTLAAEKVKLLVEANSFPAKCIEMSYEDQRILFNREKAGMQLMGNRLLNFFNKEAPSLLDRLDFFLFPEIEGGVENQTVIQGGSIAAFAINNNTIFKEETLELLKLLTGYEARSMLVNMTEDLPAGPDGFDFSKKHVLWQRLLKSLSSANGLQLHHFKYLDTKMAGTYLRTVKSLFMGKINPEDVGKTLENTINE